ncbi:MAG: tyrosine-type recombinase/integrase [Rhizobacter sp.]
MLPRMEARPWGDGKTVTYRYHPLGGKPINLGTDRVEAIRKVLDMNGENSDRETVAELWRLYQAGADWARLSENTRRDYLQCWKQLGDRFQEARPDQITPPVLARYLRVERAASPVRANREMALMSNLMNLAVEMGKVPANPCKQVRRNHEAPRQEAPEPAELQAFLEWARKRSRPAQVLAGAAEYAALAGNRRVEFLALHWSQVGDVVRLFRAKQRGRQTVELVAISEALAALFDRMRALAKDDRVGAVFPNRHGNPYTEAGFKAMWSKLMTQALAEKVIPNRFTFHDLRAYYTTQHKAEHGNLPDLHANPATTARVYDRTKEVKRRSL